MRTQWDLRVPLYLSLYLTTITLLEKLLLFHFCLPNLVQFRLLANSYAELHMEGDSREHSCLLNQVDQHNTALPKHLFLPQISKAVNIGRKHVEKLWWLTGDLVTYDLGDSQRQQWGHTGNSSSQR